MNLLARIGRTWLVRSFIRWVFVHMNFAVPVKRLRETKTLLAFRHPMPLYPVHILMVPKRAISNLLDLQEDDQDFLVEVFQTAQSLVEEFALADKGYRLILNGGSYQEFPHLHFHLISGE